MYTGLTFSRGVRHILINDDVIIYFQKVLWKLDRRFWQVMTDLPANCMYIVVLTGRNTDTGVHPAMTFAKIT